MSSSLPVQTEEVAEEVLPKSHDATPKICFAFEKGACKRGDSCRFSHDGGKTSASASRRGEKRPAEPPKTQLTRKKRKFKIYRESAQYAQ